MRYLLTLFFVFVSGGACDENRSPNTDSTDIPDTSSDTPDTDVSDDIDVLLDSSEETLGDTQDENCPVAVLTAESTRIVAHDLAIFHGSQSYSPNGPIAQFHWRAQDVDGGPVDVEFRPNANRPDVVVVPETLGELDILLDVIDMSGVRSCVTASIRVEVVASP